MYLFTRTATVATAAQIPQAVGIAMELCAYLGKHYDLKVKAGMELFGSLNIHWQYETDSLDKIMAINTKLMADKNYWAMIEKGKEAWLHGSLKDTIVNYPG